MLEYEKKLTEKGFSKICGIDEAGRGPLAGPVVAAVYVPDFSKKLVEGVDDSKKLSAKKRERLYKEITAAGEYAVCRVEPDEIDGINILEATKKAMRTAILSLKNPPDCLLIDAVRLDFPLPEYPIIHGDALSYSIAAASIIAKVERDKIMAEYAEEYPEYGFEKHKGYGTEYHIEMLKTHGACPIHRKSFIKKFV